MKGHIEGRRRGAKIGDHGHGVEIDIDVAGTDQPELFNLM